MFWCFLSQLRFGAKFASNKTGIVYNNQIADSYTLSSPWRKFSWSEENAPRPCSRPLSAMVPTILTDEDGNVRMVIGASGGTKITLSVAWVSCMKVASNSWKCIVVHIWNYESYC